METKKLTAIFLAICLGTATAKNKSDEDDCGWTTSDYVAMATGATVSIVGTPFLLAGMGFGAGGIAAGSIAAKAVGV